ncbi:MAG: hypothetical protein LUQ18_00245 [Methylococcaceae bacterium]|nr:hypothetical protein [Methylococcaceae bacterium]
MSNIEEIEDAMGVISELLELCKQQHNAAGDCLKEFKLDLRIFDKQTGELVKAGDNLQANIEKAVSLGVMASLQPVIRESLADTPKFVESALNPIFQRLDIAAQTAKQSTETAEKVNVRLNRAVLALGWKMAAIASSAAGVLVLSVYLAVGWNRAELESLTTQKAVMEKNIEELSKRKGDVHFSLCGDKQRPCVEVDNDKAYEIDKRAFYILKGVR